MRNITANNYEGVAETIAYTRLEATDDTWTNRDFLDAPYPFPEGHRVWVSVAQAGDTLDADNHFLITYTIGQKEN
jgi:hypothetical protein